MMALTASCKTSVLTGIPATLFPLMGGSFVGDEPCPMARVRRVVPIFLVPSLNFGKSPSVWLRSAQWSGTETTRSVTISLSGRISSEGTSNYVSYGLFEILVRLYWLFWLHELVEAVPPFLCCCLYSSYCILGLRYVFISSYL
jgi:hypothetical protein